MIDAAARLYGRDVVIICGQSNAGHYGADIETWPQRERYDPSVMLSNAFAASDAWVSLKDCENPTVTGVYSPGGKGTIFHSLGARMRDRGMRPAFRTISIGGASALQLQAQLPAFLATTATRLGEMTRPTVRGIVWIQGENEMAGGGAELAAWATNTAASVALVRAVVGASVPLFVVMQPLKYSPSVPAYYTYVTEERAQQASLVASDGNAHAIDLGRTCLTHDGIHWLQPSRDVISDMMADIMAA